MAEMKRFGSKERPKGEGPPFELAEQTFRTLPRGALPGAVAFQLAQAFEITKQGTAIRHVPDICQFIEQCLLDKEWVEFGPDDERTPGSDDTGRWVDLNEVGRFRVVVWGHDHVVDAQTLGDILEWLNEYHGAPRPTGRSGG